MGAETIGTELVRQSRTDRGERVLSLTGAPTMHKPPSWTHGRSWDFKPERLSITWGQGKLKRVEIRGRVIKKSGDLGVTEAYLTWWPATADRVWGGNRMEDMPDWLKVIVEANSTVPDWTTE